MTSKERVLTAISHKEADRVPAGELVLGTPESVKEQSMKYLDACKPGGGYIFATTHSIMPGAKYENYMAMLEAWKEYGVYK